MFSLDTILLDFVGSNWMSLYILITLIKGITLLTKNKKDDKAAALLYDIYNTVRGGSAPSKIFEEKEETNKSKPKESQQVSDVIS